MHDFIPRYCISCGTPLVEQTVFGEEHLACPACGWVYYEDPKVAVAALIEREGRILLTKRANDPYRGLWTLPAGFLNAREDPLRAVEREVREETALEIEAVELLEIFAGREHPRGSDLLLVYSTKVTGGALKAGDDADDAGFFAASELPPLAFHSTELILTRHWAPFNSARGHEIGAVEKPRPPHAS